jgi:hypothetical protein
MAKCRPILLPLMAIWQQDFARRKPLFLLAANFRCADDRLSNSGIGSFADGHRVPQAQITGAQPFRTPSSAQ